MNRRPAAAKVNLSLTVGRVGGNGKHEVATVLQRVALADRISIEPARRLEVRGFDRDTLVRDALAALAEAAAVQPCWRIRIYKRIPVGAGLGGGSSDAATALRLANASLDRPLDDAALRCVAATIGADVPFFLAAGPQLGTGDGTELTPLDLPQDYWVLLIVPGGAVKLSTGDVYGRFDDRAGHVGYEERRARLLGALRTVRRSGDLALLPQNDLASSPLSAELRAAGAFRADVSGAGPAVYGLFDRRRSALAAAGRFRRHGRVWITVPAWYF